MPLRRYDHIDEYTSSELKLWYEAGDTRARIALLRKLRRSGSLPDVIVELAINDNDPRVRQTLALSNVWYLSDDTVKRLREDPEPAVRAAVCENRGFLSSAVVRREYVKLFESLNHAERLALMRNPMLDGELVEKILNREDTELQLTDIERAQFVFSYLANEDAFDARHLDTDSYVKSGIPNYDAYDMVRKNTAHFERIWKLAAQWDWWDLKSAVYATIPVSDDLRLEAYKQNENEWVRRSIVRACSATDVKTLKAATEDKEEAIARLAREKLPVESTGKKKSNALSYSWTVLVGVVELIVAIALLASANSIFEKLSISLLVLIYVTIRIVIASVGLSVWEQAAIGLTRYLHILKLMRDPEYEKSREDLDYEMKEAGENLRKGVITVRIRSIILDLIGITAIVFIVVALLH